MNGPRVESRSQSVPKCASTSLLLGRLAEDAHVRDAAVRDEVARAGRVAAELRALRVALLRLLDLAGDRRDQHVAAQAARVAERAHGLDVAGERALHVRDAEPVDAAVALEALRLEAGIPASHGSRPEYDVSMWPLNISVGPPPAPARVPSTFARPSSTCCHCTASPSSAQLARTSTRPCLLRRR